MNGKQLKNAILQLAIQGKLVPQDAADEPASALLAKIRKEKEQLVKSGKLKKEKVLPPIIDMPFEIPRSWTWVRLGDYCERVTDQVASGSFASLRENVKSLKGNGYAIMVKTADFSNNFTRNLTYTDEHGYRFLENSNLFGGELILSNIGSIGKIFVVPKLNYPMTLAPNSVMVRLIEEQCRDYLFYYFQSPFGYKQLLSITTGTAMKKFNKTDLKTILIPLPPLSEQRRIVAKIEELMPLVEEFGAAQEKLNRLNAALPAALKKSILQQAIQGKLVPQDATDEPAAALLAKIRKEKEQLVKAGKLKPACRQAGKKDLETTPITDDEKPFEIPENWEWCRLGEITDVLGGYAFQSQDIKGETGTRVIRISDFNEFGWVNNKIARYNDKELLSQYEIKANDILLAMTGGTVGKSLFIRNIPERMLLNQRVAIVRSSHAFPAFVDLIIKSPLIQDIINERKNSTNDNISMGDITGFLIPLPPLAEQRRIVAKVEDLFAVVEGMEGSV